MAKEGAIQTITVESEAGIRCGHVPGNQYCDVLVKISRRSTGRWRVSIDQATGSAQGCDEEHGRIKVVGIGDSLDDAVRDAKAFADSANIRGDFLAEALSQAADLAEEEMANDTD